MDKEQFLQILNKYQEGNATPEEIDFLTTYYNLFELEPEVLQSFSLKKKDDLKKRMENNLFQKIDKDESPRISIFNKYRWIAAAAILVIISAVSFLLIKTQMQEQVLVTQKTGNAIQRNSFVQLPDGSTAVISAGSKLNYPSSFEGRSKREVYLVGTAFFDIKHNSSKAFIVHTGDVSTTVLGTAFNIKAMAGENLITVTVTRGRVKVSNKTKTLGLLNPNDQVIYNITKDEVSQNTTSARQAVEWRKEDLLFDDVTIANAAKLLEERYHVNITVSDEQLRDQRFTTTLGKNETLEHVLASICDFNNAVYEYDKQNKSIKINPNK